MKPFLCSFALVLVVGLGANTQTKPAQATKPVLVIEPIAGAQAVGLPPDWLAEFSGHLVEGLRYSQAYEQVVGPDSQDRPAGALHLRVTLIAFSKGSRTARYMVGFGAGREKLKAEVVLENAAGKKLYHEKLQSTTTMGLAGSKSGETPRKLAQEVVRQVVAHSE
jgi:hypothetical protein